ncbi:hypothetical protein L1S35_06365 [Flavobacterium sp. AS60]|uniref:hypothetical protein n=1 Tax=Flavobacterium anseongense TaxID=2910677 RepID=UPI001F4211B1|nr:hypothetical protein [Flavobacterium sp. AS60]MCF6129290.1 hypothetical protein [Flavobacterium sp. AS60]
MKKSALFLFLASFLFVSCSDNENENVVVGDTISTELKNLFSQNTDNLIQTFHMNASDNSIVFTSPNGVALTIDRSCLRKNGAAVTGIVDFEYIEIFDKGTMLVTNKTTLGLVGTEKHLLTSGGEFYINATQGGEQLTMTCSMFLNVPTSITGGTDNNMNGFTGDEDANGNIFWSNSTSNEFWASNLSPAAAETYNTFVGEFGWFNCDRFLNYPGAKTKITAYVPQEYGNGNSLMFLAAKDFPNSLGQTSGTYPIGLECSLIFVAEENGSIRYAIKQNIVLTANHQVTFESSEMATATTAEMVTIINALQ